MLMIDAMYSSMSYTSESAAECSLILMRSLIVKGLVLATVMLGFAAAPAVAQRVSLDDLPWVPVKGISLGMSYDEFVKQFNPTNDTLQFGQIKLSPIVLSENEMCAAGFRDGVLVALVQNWMRINQERSRAIIAPIFKHLRLEDPNPKLIKTEKIFGNSIGKVTAYSFSMSTKGKGVRALLESTELGTVVVVHDSSRSAVEESLPAPGQTTSPHLMQKPPVEVLDYLIEIATVKVNGSESKEESPPIFPGTGLKLPPSTSAAPTPKTSEVKPTPTFPSEEPASSTPWSIIVVLIVAATGLLWLLVKKRK